MRQQVRISRIEKGQRVEGQLQHPLNPLISGRSALRLDVLPVSHHKAPDRACQCRVATGRDIAPIPDMQREDALPSNELNTVQSCIAFTSWRTEGPSTISADLQKDRHLDSPCYAASLMSQLEFVSARTLFKWTFLNNAIARDPLLWTTQCSTQRYRMQLSGLQKAVEIIYKMHACGCLT